MSLALLSLQSQLMGLGGSPFGADIAGGKAKEVNGEDTDAGVTATSMATVSAYAAGAAGLALVSIVTAGSVLVFASGGLMCALAPYMAYQKYQLLGLSEMRGQINMLRNNTNELHSENDKLEEAIDDLENQIAELSEVEVKFRGIAEESGTQVEKLQEILAENDRLQNEIEESLERQVIQDMLTMVIRCDKDGDFELDDQEQEDLIRKLKQVRGIKFDEAKFRHVIENDEGAFTIEDFMEVVKNLKDKDLPEEKKIFHLDAKDLLAA